MLAMTYRGPYRVRVVQKPIPEIEHARDAIVRVPFADAGPLKIPDGVDDDNAALCTDAYPTGYQGAEMAQIKRGDSVVVFGAGPVGLFAARCAWFFGAGRVLIVDEQDYRLDFARRFAHCET